MSTYALFRTIFRVPVPEPHRDTGTEWLQDLGADVIVAQDSEAGGHGGSVSTTVLVPQVVDVAGSTHVVAAGGFVDGRGLLAALAMGA
jgi:NAD(P)H-dependent flavin oxidoreductase YrpB (nitropropane dioxygenase family)